MDQDEEAPASSPFAPRSALVRTPPSGLATPHARLRNDDEEDMTLTPGAPSRPLPPRPQPSKRPLTSPEERRPVDVVRMCRPSPEHRVQRDSSPAAPIPNVAAAGAGVRPRAPPPLPPAVLPPRAQKDLLSLPRTRKPVNTLWQRRQKVELLDRVHEDLAQVMALVTGPLSRLNKDSTNAIGARVQDTLAVVAALSLRLCEMEANWAGQT